MITRIRQRLADRNTLPRWLNALIDHVADHPMSIVGRIASRRYGSPSAHPGTIVTEFGDASQRLLIAPVNYSGQGREWARAIERVGADISARNMAIDVPGGFAYDADLVVPVPVYQNDTDWQRRQFDAASAATHVLVEAQEPPFGRLLGRDTGRQVKALRARGVEVAFMCHGTDIRLPSRHIDRTPWSLYRDPQVYVPRMEKVARRNRELLDRVGLPVFVSTPDLLADVAEGTWVPVVVDPRRWRRPGLPSASGVGPLRVTHAPSVSRLKGTDLIEPVLEKLSREGIIDYQRIAGTPSALMPEAYHRAEVLLDQFRAGSYGVAACEAMAAGCAVVGHVIDEVRGEVQKATGSQLPVIEATPDTLESVLRALAADREQLRLVQQQSLDYVGAVHDGRLSASILLESWIRTTPSLNQRNVG